MKDMTLIDLLRMFPDDDTAKRWFENARWPDGIRCAYCEDTSYANMKHPTMPYRCRKCRKYFSVKTNSLMHASNLGYQKWALAIFLMTTSIKGISSLRLHEYIGVTQKTAWHLAHRIREAYDIEHEKFSGECEVDEAYIGGLEENKHASKRLRVGGGTAGKIPMIRLHYIRIWHCKANVLDDTSTYPITASVTTHYLSLVPASSLTSCNNLALFTSEFLRNILSLSFVPATSKKNARLLSSITRMNRSRISLNS